MGLPTENADAYERASALTKAADLNAKLLLLHNLEDDNVHFQNTVQMMDALEARGQTVRADAVPSKGAPRHRAGTQTPLRNHDRVFRKEREIARYLPWPPA
jgi:hypothetical protein